jgi:hypothetical protein
MRPVMEQVLGNGGMPGLIPYDQVVKAKDVRQATRRLASGSALK